MPKNRLRELRRENGESLAELAGAVGVHESTIWRWERGVVGIPDRRKVELADYFAVSVPFLMGWEDNGGDDGPVAA